MLPAYCSQDCYVPWLILSTYDRHPVKRVHYTQRGARPGNANQLVHRQMSYDISIRIQCNPVHPTQVTRTTQPMAQVFISSPDVNQIQIRQQFLVSTPMTLILTHTMDNAVAMLEVVPTREVRSPSSRGFQRFRVLGREFRLVFRGAEQRFGVGVVFGCW